MSVVKASCETDSQKSPNKMEDSKPTDLQQLALEIKMLGRRFEVLEKKVSEVPSQPSTDDFQKPSYSVTLMEQIPSIYYPVAIGDLTTMPNPTDALHQRQAFCNITGRNAGFNDWHPVTMMSRSIPFLGTFETDRGVLHAIKHRNHRNPNIDDIRVKGGMPDDVDATFSNVHTLRKYILNRAYGNISPGNITIPDNDSMSIENLQEEMRKVDQAKYLQEKGIRLHDEGVEYTGDNPDTTSLFTGELVTEDSDRKLDEEKHREELFDDENHITNLRTILHAIRGLPIEESLRQLLVDDNHKICCLIQAEIDRIEAHPQSDIKFPEKYVTSPDLLEYKISDQVFREILFHDPDMKISPITTMRDYISDYKKKHLSIGVAIHVPGLPDIHVVYDGKTDKVWKMTMDEWNKL